MASMSATETRSKAGSDRGGERLREPSVTISVFACWIVPVLFIAALTRFAVDTGPAFIPAQSKPMTLTFDEATPTSQPSPTRIPASKEKAAEMPTLLANKPTGYHEVVKSIGRRRLDWTSTSSVYEYVDGGQTVQHSPTSATAATASEPSNPATSHPTSQQMKKPPRGASSDPVRMELVTTIDELRKEFREQPQNLLKAVALADSLRMYDVQYHDGGTAQEEAIETYKQAIQLGSETRQRMVDKGEETNLALNGLVDVNEEITLDYTARSVDGLLCALHTGLGKTYFMANMFEKAVESYNKALEIEPIYLDAMSSRGSSRIILGDYEEAGRDFMTVMKNDTKRRFQDVFTGLARVLQARESAVPEGWEPMIQILNEMCPMLESQLASISHPEGKAMVASSLNRFYHVLFLYHDVKTKDTDLAWEFLTKSYHHKMSALPAWNAGFESQKIAATKQIFHRGFWPTGVGSETETPIFIIGFVRSGSTLLERVLDAHPQIIGTGENSVFNGQLDGIRNKIVETSMLGDPSQLTRVIQDLADGVVDEMRQRWQMVASGENRAADRQDSRRFVDKMLTNYYNVGFIHMLFPNALILHVAREPMDTIFSAYKHEFPSGPLDYTSDFQGLTELYHGYRDLMEHWDKELPGRVTHIRYEDMVNDMPGVSRQIIGAAGLEWDDGVLDFHKKKHAVNTLSTTQVRKGVYRDSLQAWRRYETHLKPLVRMIGEQTQFALRTTLAGYAPPTSEGEEAKPLREAFESHGDGPSTKSAPAVHSEEL